MIRDQRNAHPCGFLLFRWIKFAPVICLIGGLKGRLKQPFIANPDGAAGFRGNVLVQKKDTIFVYLCHFASSRKAFR